MYSTTTIVKNPKKQLAGKRVGTHQQLDQAARKLLGKHLPQNYYFPTAKEIIYFEGMRGPDGLKRKSPDIDDPSHMLDGGESCDLFTQICDHYYNLVQALHDYNEVRAAFEAAWMGHKITDGLTPAHHFPLSEAKEELMSNKEFIKIFGEPIKGIMHGRTPLETARNNWIYWGAGGYMTKHIAYEYGVAIIAAILPNKSLLPSVDQSEFRDVDFGRVFFSSLEKVQAAKMYDRFRQDGWTTDLAYDTKDLLLPEIVHALALCWYSAVEVANSPEKFKKLDEMIALKISKNQKLQKFSTSKDSPKAAEFKKTSEPESSRMVAKAAESDKSEKTKKSREAKESQSAGKPIDAGELAEPPKVKLAKESKNSAQSSKSQLIRNTPQLDKTSPKSEKRES